MSVGRYYPAGKSASARTDFSLLDHIRRSGRVSRDPKAAIVRCDVPVGSALDPSLLADAYFSESYRTSITRPTSDPVDIFFAIFGHQPVWLKLALAVRNGLASWGGLDAPKPMDIFNVQRKNHYAVGEVIGVWPIFALTKCELIAGRDNKHLDFRVSILKRNADQTGAVAVVSTICVVHNWAGKAYLFFVLPFHRWGMKMLIARAHRKGRL